MNTKTSSRSDLTQIPGIGKTFVRDFARININDVAALKGQSPEHLYQRLVAANAKEGHSTSKNYLYVIRMAVHYANRGGIDPSRPKWNDFKDA